MKSIQEIHNSNLYGVIIEAGCSATIASTLMNVAGASKTIYRSEQPYSKEYQESLYGKFNRSVSKEWIKQVLETEAKSSNINFVLASSWQLLDPNNPLVYTHGWIGIFDIQKNVKHYLHFTFNRDLDLKNDNLHNREAILKTIGELAVSILHTLIDGNIEELVQIDADKAILDMAYQDDNINYHLLINTLEKANGDYFLVFHKNEVIRFEDLMRTEESFVMQKGSFNPLHHGHIHLMEKSVVRHGSNPAFLISTYRYDKPHINYDELKDRIEQFYKSGYPLIIYKSVLFYETFDLLQKWSNSKKFYFPIGTDTINRIYQTDLDTYKDNLNNSIKNMVDKYKDIFMFILFDRAGYVRNENTILYNEIIEEIEYVDDGISSSKIRNGELNNKL